MGRTFLVLGGARSGKSQFAEQLAVQNPPVTYLATAAAGDQEMRDRIEQHRQRRPLEWRTIEVPLDLPPAVAMHGASSGTILVECVTLWVSNLLLAERRPDAAAIRQRVADSIQAARGAKADVVWVSNEVGAGIVPDNALAREFRDRLGEANQSLAATADGVYFCVAGIATKLK